MLSSYFLGAFRRLVFDGVSYEVVGMALDDDASSDVEWFNADHVESRPARPRLNIEDCSDGTLFGIFDQAGVTA